MIMKLAGFGNVSCSLKNSELKEVLALPQKYTEAAFLVGVA